MRKARPTAGHKNNAEMGVNMTVIYKIISILFRMKYKRHLKGEGKVFIDPRLCHFVFGEKSSINLNGNLKMGANAYGNNGRSNLLRMDDGAVLDVNGNFKFMYGADVVIFSKGHLTLGNNSFINSDCKIRCHKNIVIGDDCAISHDCIIMDSDAHYLEGDNHTKDVVIEDKVWIGSRVTVLSGSRIGTGSVIAAGSVVNGDIPEYSLAAGIPARVIRMDVKWER